MITALLVIVLAGVALYLVEHYIPMSEPFKVVLKVVVVLFLILYLLQLFGVVDVPLPRR